MECCHFWVSGVFFPHYYRSIKYFLVFAQSNSVICLSAQRELLLKMVSPLFLHLKNSVPLMSLGSDF